MRQDLCWGCAPIVSQTTHPPTHPSHECEGVLSVLNPHLTEEETEAQKSEVTWPSSFGPKAAELGQIMGQLWKRGQAIILISS